MANVTKINYSDFELQDYNAKDENLIKTFDINNFFNTSSCIEFFIFDRNQNILHSKYDYTNYSVLNNGQSSLTNELSTLQINPGNDVTSAGFNSGEYVAYYNFLQKEIGDYNLTLYVSEISSDRTELRLDSSFISNRNLLNQTEIFIHYRNNQKYYFRF